MGMVEAKPDRRTLMFAPYCPRHDSRILLFTENIDAIEKGEAGLTIRFHCTCGYRGIWNRAF